MTPEQHTDGLDIIRRVCSVMAARHHTDPGEYTGLAYETLIAAAVDYDPARGSSWRTYAANRIRWAILDERRAWYRRSQKVYPDFQEEHDNSPRHEDTHIADLERRDFAESLIAYADTLPDRKISVSVVVRCLATGGTQAETYRRLGVSESGVSLCIRNTLRPRARRMVA